MHHSIHRSTLCLRHVMYHFKFIICICLVWEGKNFSVCHIGVTLFKQDEIIPFGCTVITRFAEQ